MVMNDQITSGGGGLGLNSTYFQPCKLKVKLSVHVKEARVTYEIDLVEDTDFLF